MLCKEFQGDSILLGAINHARVIDWNVLAFYRACRNFCAGIAKSQRERDADSLRTMKRQKVEVASALVDPSNDWPFEFVPADVKNHNYSADFSN